ncbi:type VI secretion system contractile sheath small subunit [Mesorhizobium silamurunense]|uniref:type VI secretion system contractile sheath small subunit n=1 Tax=Mesorhizobium silamurunense TaxID=499528 RepID=UPI00178512C7|nr:type VI secretion system contractile sheath small subunit [Mesorhizobium silamurunense]
MAKASSQKFINRNRPPRVQIEYDLETYGSQKKVELPFVVGVMSDLAGNPAQPLPPVGERKMMEIDADNFDDRLRSLSPRVAMRVPNRLTGKGQLAVDLTFESMDDFSPAAVARKVGSLSALLQARMQLSNLLAYMDGKMGAEELIARFLANPALLSNFSGLRKSEATDEAPDEAVEAPSSSAETKEQ